MARAVLLLRVAGTKISALKLSCYLKDGMGIRGVYNEVKYAAKSLHFCLARGYAN